MSHVHRTPTFAVHRTPTLVTSTQRLGLGLGLGTGLGLGLGLGTGLGLGLGLGLALFEGLTLAFPSDMCLTCAAAHSFDLYVYIPWCVR